MTENEFTNATSTPIHDFCSKEWHLDFDNVFHVGNVILGVAFLVPQDFELAILSLRTLAATAFGFLVFWSLNTICGFDIFVYNSLFLVVNVVYSCKLMREHCPVFIPREQQELYKKIFEPLKVSKKDFRLLTRDSQIVTIRGGRTFAIENDTETASKDDARPLRILLTGKLAVKCDDVFLHFIQPLEFVDSIEWWAKTQANPANVFKVGIDAVQDSDILVLKRLEEKSDLNFLVECLTAKDATRKLYAMHGTVYENQTSSENHNHDNKTLLDFHRTNSSDAIATGCKGNVRSKAWTSSKAALASSANDQQLMVLNFDLDIPPSMTYLPHNVPVHSVDRATMAEAQFIAQQRKYWPAGLFV